MAFCRQHDWYGGPPCPTCEANDREDRDDKYRDAILIIIAKLDRIIQLLETLKLP
jgi:hypothetical protein